MVVQVEFAVQMSGPGCAEKVENSLRGVGTVNIDVPSGRVVVHSSLPWTEIQERIEQSGRRAVLSGFGGKFDLSKLFTQISVNESFRCQINQQLPL